MKRAQIGFETGAEDRFLNALVQLEQMWVPGADANPDNLRPAFGRKRSEADQWKEK
jgi:hypothetical protein